MWPKRTLQPDSKHGSDVIPAAILRSLLLRGQTLRLPKPIYEAMPLILVGSGALSITLALKRYEYVPTVLTWLVGIFCILGGLLLLTIRLIYRIRSRAEEDG